MESPPWPDAVYVGDVTIYTTLSIADGIYAINTTEHGSVIIDFHMGVFYYCNIRERPHLNRLTTRFWYGYGCPLTHGVTYDHFTQLDGVKICGFAFVDTKSALILSVDYRWMVMRPRTFCGVWSAKYESCFV